MAGILLRVRRYPLSLNSTKFYSSFFNKSKPIDNFQPTPIFSMGNLREISFNLLQAEEISLQDPQNRGGFSEIDKNLDREF